MMKDAPSCLRWSMRGMYTAGVLDCFMDHDISFDAVIGVSAGALFWSEPAVKAAWQGYTIQ